MSRSNENTQKNPAKHFIEWKGGVGKLEYFDKERGEKGEKVEIPIPFTFLVLDVLSTIKGFSDEMQSGFWSNEVRSTIKEKFTVKSKKGIIDSGLYRDIIGKKELTGAKYCQSTYVAYKQGKDLILANIQMTGAALNSWIEFRKKNDIYKGAVKITGSKKAKKGTTTYFVPVFEKTEVSEETNEKAIILDKQLQDYLKVYFGNTESEELPLTEMDKIAEEVVEEITERDTQSVENKDITDD